MAYPSLHQAEGTKPVARAGTQLRYASNGAVSIRDVQGATKYDPVVVHRMLTATEYATFTTFYASNRASTFTFTYVADSTSVTCCFAERPYEVDVMVGAGGAKFYNVSVHLVAT